MTRHRQRQLRPTRRLSLRFCIALGSIALIATCRDEPSVAPPLQVRSEAPTIIEPKVPPSPQEFVADVDPEAAVMLGNVAMREQLSQRYAASGYVALAWIMAENVPPAIGYTVSWLCSMDDISGPSNSALEEVKRERSRGNLERALTLAQAGIVKNPESCQMKMEWAISILMRWQTDASAVSREDQERAVRILITGAAEIGVLPSDYSSGAAMVRDVARYFKQAGDTASYRRALLLAEGLIRAEGSRTDSPTVLAELTALHRKIEMELAEVPR